MAKSVDSILLQARKHARKGQLEEAATLYKGILKRFPGNQRALQGLNALSKTTASPALRPAKPTQQDANRLAALYSKGALQDTADESKRLIAQFPDSAFLYNILGAAEAGMGDHKTAVASYGIAVRLNPGHADAHNNMGVAQAALGRTDDAIESYRRAIALNPLHADAHNNLGAVLQHSGDLDAAEASYRRAIEIEPDHSDAHNNLGTVLQAIGMQTEAEESFRKAVSFNPGFAQAHNNLGNVLSEQTRTGEAIASHRQAINAWPIYAEGHVSLANALKKSGQPEAAVDSYRRAIEINPDHANALNGLGNVYQQMGLLEQAEQQFKRAIAVDPAHASAHRSLSKLTTFTAGDPHLDQMQALLKSPDLPEMDRSQLCFALAKAHEDTGDLDGAFAHLCRGNRIKKDRFGYDIATDRALFARLKATFATDDAALSKAATAAPATGATPVFILGMPRSGTTLVEQILSSHPDLHGAGELDFLDSAVTRSGWSDRDPDDDMIRSIRKSYLADLSRIETPAKFISDKMPLNFRWIGFIVNALPEARIIHTNRDARATCWSIFSQSFASTGNGYADDLRDVTAYYGLYRDLMALWRQRYPDRIFDLDYQMLTEHQERETRRLLDFVGLPWDASCLNFHKTKRAVRTASATQVRKKLYTGSSEKWRRYQAHLADFISDLSEY